MLVILPTYNRLDQLRWSLESVLLSRLENSEQPRLVVLSNSPGKHDDVEKIMTCVRDRIEASRRWEIHLEKRSKTLLPATNWYSALKDFAKDGECVFLHGDDDLLCPWGLEQRIAMMRETSADLLISRMIVEIYFDGPNHCYPPGLPHQVRRRPKEFTLSSGYLDGALFIGNNCYRYSDRMRCAIEQSFHWCEAQDFLNAQTSTALVPMYMPLSCLSLGMKVFETELPCEIRGIDMEEYSSSAFGNRDWNFSLCYLSALDILCRPPLSELPELESRRRAFASVVTGRFFSMFFDKKVDRGALKILLQRCRENLAGQHFSKLKSLLYVMIEKLSLRRFVIAEKCRRISAKRTSTIDWMKQLATWTPRETDES